MSYPPAPAPAPSPSPLLVHHHQPFHPVVIITTAAILWLCIIAVHPPQVSCFNDLPQQSSPPSSPNKGLLVEEEKSRLGSTPPSCHNKCNSCHPCMAVQVPTLPSRTRVRPGPSSQIGTTESFDPYYNPPGNRYSNYKPLGWKCRCGDHLYNP